MTLQQQQAWKEHIQSITEILYEAYGFRGVDDAGQSQVQKHILPEVGVVLS